MSETPKFDRVMIYTDGACSGNPGKGGWAAIIVTPEGQVEELGDVALETTNNRMELMAPIAALERLKGRPGGIDIYTDSVYVIKGITQWIWGWRKRGWKNAQGEDVKNKELWERLSRAVAPRKGDDQIEWHHVRGHAGIPGNERCDEIAVGFAQGKPPSLYRGSLIKYFVPVHDLPDDTSVPERSSSKKKKVTAFSYLSLVGGIARRHSTWAQCESAVKGRSGAKFKKSTSATNELEILREWDVDPSSVK